MTTPTQETIQIGGSVYVVAQLPQRVRSLIDVFTKWQADLNTARLEVAKNEAAIRDLGREIQQEMAVAEQFEHSKVQQPVAGTEDPVLEKP